MNIIAAARRKRCYIGGVTRPTRPMTRSKIAAFLGGMLAVSICLAGQEGTGDVPSRAELEAAGAIVGEIVIDKENVFDTGNPAENNALYRLANRWHVLTRDGVISGQLLFKTGDAFSNRLLEESERLLRGNAYFYDARIEPLRYADGVVDIRVWTRDLWTLMPGVSVSRSGGENRTRLSLSERNLLGSGASLGFNYVDNVDRETLSVDYFDRNLGRTWTSLFMEIADSSDGETADFRLVRPFYALDARWSAGATLYDDTRAVSFYSLGKEVAAYAADTEQHTLFYGWSTGLQAGWVRRWSAGVAFEQRRFSVDTSAALPALLPADRKFVYPYVGVELVEDGFESTANRDQIDRTEDFNLGTRLWASVGFASEGFGSDRDAFLVRGGASRGFGSIASKALLLDAGISGRIDEGSATNAEIRLTARLYNQINDKRLIFMTMDASRGRRLDLDNLADLGGDSGLRGYPLRYQTGDARFLLTIEQRYFTDWYPFRLFRVGGAMFADLGRTWGDGPLGTKPLGWLSDVGIGLRLAPTRASGRDVVHIDIAFPMNGDSSIDEVQFLIEKKRSF